MYTQFDPLVSNYLNAQDEVWNTRETLESRLLEIFDVSPDTILWEDDINIDTCDWDGTSLEITDAKHFHPTDEQIEKIWALGFTVIRIDYEDPEFHTPRHGMSGDWRLVKGYPQDRCPCNMKLENE